MSSGTEKKMPGDEDSQEVVAKESWRLPVILVAFGVFGTLVAYNAQLWTLLFNDRVQGNSVGTVSRERGGVRLRSGGSLAWNDVGGSDHKVATGDAIFTGRDGDARLLLRDGSLTQVSPNSLVIVDYAEKKSKSSIYARLLEPVFESKKTALSLKVEKGEVSVQSGATPLKIEARDKTFKVDQNQQTPVEVRVDPDDSDEPVQVSSEQPGAKVQLIDKMGEQPFQVKRRERKRETKDTSKTSEPVGEQKFTKDALQQFKLQRNKKVEELRNHVELYDHPGLLVALVLIVIFCVVELILTIRARVRTARAKKLAEVLKQQKVKTKK